MSEETGYIARRKLKKWVPTTDIATLRKLGKLMEELGELSAVAARCIIQGVDKIDPSSGRLNMYRLKDEIADVYAQLDDAIAFFNIPTVEIEERRQGKRQEMQTWDDMLNIERK